jgi:hypothetical protein
MEGFPFDDHDRDAVFGAAAGAPDVPESLRDVAALVHAARRSGSADELVGEAALVAEITAAMAAMGKDAAQPRRSANERIPVFQKLRTAKLAAAATVALMVGGTAAAAATGSLPTSSETHHRAELASSREAATVVASDDGHESEHRHDKVFGTVASVNGVSDPGTCGVAGADGAFTVEDHDGETWTVNVSADTEFFAKHHHDDDSSFADVCVDSRVKAKGTLEDTTLTATKVKIKRPRVHQMSHDHARKGAFGQIASVNGVSDPGTCGTAGTAGSFVVNGFKGETFTVNVDPSTAFAAKDVTDASFANVCVGLLSFAKGDVTDSTVTATAVFVVPPKADEPEDDGDHHGVFGEVTSVNGVGDEGTCGTEGADGSFTIVDRDGNTVTVNVTAATQFFGKHHWDDDDEGTSFADVCVAKLAGAKGEQTDAVVAAEMVFVSGDHHRGDWSRHDGDKDDCDGRRHGDRGDDDHDGRDRDRGDKDRHGDRGDKDRHGDDGGWDDHGHDDD